MSFAAPIWLLGGGIAALVVLGLHLLARRQPRPFSFPPVRFIPDLPASAASFARKPVDLLLLLLRVSVVLLLAVALARPHLPPPANVLRLVLVDRSRAARPADDSATATLLRDADRVIAFDSGGRGSLSTALITAMRSAETMAGQGDSIELTIVSPFAEEEWDDATLLIRRVWEGRIALVPISTATDSATSGSLEIASDDPLHATLALLALPPELSPRLVRSVPTAADSAWANEGGALVYWPRHLVGSSWSRTSQDTAPGVMAAEHAVVAAFPLPRTPPPGKIIARWSDGSPAATERPLGAGCQRDVAIPVMTAGDLVLRGSMIALTRELLAPCGGGRSFVRAGTARLDSLRGSGALLATGQLGRRDPVRVPANPWILIASATLFLLEPVVRRKAPLS